jgi:pentapeptide repeat protein
LLRGATLDGASLKGAGLDGAELHGVSLNRAQLQGATLDSAELEGSDLRGADFRGALLDHARLQGALIDGAQFRGASLMGTYVFRTSGNADLTDARLVGGNYNPVFPVVWQRSADIDTKTVSWWTTLATSEVLDERRKKAISERMSRLNPGAIDQASDEAAKTYWSGKETMSIASEAYQRLLGDYLTSLACQKEFAPHVARSLLQSTVAGAAGPYFLVLSEALRSGRLNTTSCLGTAGFVEEDWERLDRLVDAAPRPSATVVSESICSGVAAPYVARAFIKNGLLASVGDKLPAIAAKMRAARLHSDICPGVKHFTEEDWNELTSVFPEPIVSSVPGEALTGR